MYARYRKAMGLAWSTYDITRFGAVGDGRRDNTQSIQAAIDTAAGHGGGVVRVPAGRFVTGVLTMRSDITLQLDSGAVLLGSTHRLDYGPGQALPLIRASGQRHLAIEGHGVIDGQGDSLLADLYAQLRAGRIADAEWQTPNPWGQVRPAEENRPKLILFDHCDQVTIRGITLRNGLDWIQEYKSCSHMRIDSIRVESNIMWNNDGIDLVDCKQVRLTNSFFNADDDGICLKSEDRRDSCADIYIARCTIRSSASALKFGTASRGGFYRITVRDIRVYDTYRSAIALEAVDGGRIEQVDIRNVQARNTGNAFFIRLGHRNKDSVYSRIRGITIAHLDVGVPAGKPDAGYPMEGPPAPGIHSVLPASIAGLPGHPVQDVSLEDIRVSYPGGGVPPDGSHAIPENAADYPEFSMFGDLPAWGLYLRHVDGLRLKRVTMDVRKPDGRERQKAEDVRFAAP
jgi:polygalacturonase